MVQRRATFRFLLDIKDFVTKGRIATQTVDQINQKSTQASTSVQKMGQSMQQSGQQSAAAAVNFQTATQGMLNLSTAGVQTFTSFSNLDRAGNRLAASQVAVARAQDLLNNKQLRLNEALESGSVSSAKIANLEREIATARADLAVKTDKLKIEEGALFDIQLLFVTNIANVMISSIQTINSLRQIQFFTSAKVLIQEKLLGAVFVKNTVSVGGYTGALANLNRTQQITSISSRGLLLTFGPIGAALAGVTIALQAYNENWGGFRDVVQEILPFLKDKKETLNKVNEELAKGEQAVKDYVKTEKTELNKSNELWNFWATQRSINLLKVAQLRKELGPLITPPTDFSTASRGGGNQTKIKLPPNVAGFLRGAAVIAEIRNDLNRLSNSGQAVQSLSFESRFLGTEAGLRIAQGIRENQNFPSLGNFQNQVDRLINIIGIQETFRLLENSLERAESSGDKSFTNQAQILIFKQQIARLEPRLPEAAEIDVGIFGGGFGELARIETGNRVENSIERAKILKAQADEFFELSRALRSSDPQGAQAANEQGVFFARSAAIAAREAALLEFNFGTNTGKATRLAQISRDLATSSATRGVTSPAINFAISAIGNLGFSRPRQTGVVGGVGALGGQLGAALAGLAQIGGVTSPQFQGFAEAFATARGLGIPSAFANQPRRLISGQTRFTANLLGLVGGSEGSLRTARGNRGLTGSSLAAAFAGRGAARNRSGGHSKFRQDRLGGRISGLIANPSFGRDFVGLAAREALIRSRGRRTNLGTFQKFLRSNQDITKRLGNARGEINNLFPLFTDIPQPEFRRAPDGTLMPTFQNIPSFSSFEGQLAILREFREEVLTLTGINFSQQSEIELDVRRTRNELEDRVRFTQRLGKMQTGSAGF